MYKQSVNIRDEFHFSEIRGSMNATGPVQSKRLQVTRRVHTSMNLRKMKFISKLKSHFI